MNAPASPSSGSLAVDLYLGSDLGLWVLDNIDPSDAHRVVTIQDDIASKAQEFGLDVHRGHANTLESSGRRVALSVHYQRILGQELLDSYESAYNLHPGYLPWGRGYYPMFWALWNGEPAGATLHEMVAGIDEGPLVDRIRVPCDGATTPDDLFDAVRSAEKRLFHDFWPMIASGQTLETQPQEGQGSYHSRRDFADVLDSTEVSEMTGAELIDLVRCLTFSRYPGFRVTMAGRAFEVTVRPSDIA